MAHHSATTNDAGPSPVAPHRLQELWLALNARYFNGALSPIRIFWSRRLTASAGMFVTRVGPRARRHNATDTGTERRLIRLSLPLLLDQPEREIVVTLAHEMIHQWQFERLKRRPNHGPDFHHMMETMNRNTRDNAARSDPVAIDVEPAVASSMRWFRLKRQVKKSAVKTVSHTILLRC